MLTRGGREEDKKGERRVSPESVVNGRRNDG